VTKRALDESVSGSNFYFPFLDRECDRTERHLQFDGSELHRPAVEGADATLFGSERLGGVAVELVLATRGSHRSVPARRGYFKMSDDEHLAYEVRQLRWDLERLYDVWPTLHGATPINLQKGTAYFEAALIHARNFIEFLVRGTSLALIFTP
jgi:hypothetical protein